MTSPARSLLSAAAVRERAHEMLRLAEAGRVEGWRVDRARLPAVADYVHDTMRANYPTLDIPFHARWRHFSTAGRDRWAPLAARLPDANIRGRSAYDFAIVSVLLDAGAGPDWSYREADGTTTRRSEGLAVASLDMFAAGAFSSDPAEPLRADAAGLRAVTPDALARGFQVSAGNPLVGLDGRAALLRRLGDAIAARPDLFGTAPARPGDLFDHLVARAAGGSLPAPVILEALLDGLGPVWPSRLSLDGVPLGDTWRHPALRRDDATDGLVPFHKLSQWLAYSLIEPLQWAGIEVVDIDGLTGLPEYRNGGLLIDLGLLVPTNPGALARAYPPGAPFIVAWRALTVALLDEIADAIRARLGLDRAALPLARVLEGGTWAAGRRIARETRADGGPPLQIVSDGTVF